MNLLSSKILYLAGLSLLLLSCKPDDLEVPAPAEASINITHSVGDEVVEPGVIKYSHPADYEYSVETLVYFLSDFTFYTAGGDSVHLDMAHYVDFSDESSLSFSPGLLNEGNYTHISFNFGLDSALNQTGRFPNMPEVGMQWPQQMGGGYHYMKLEGKYEVPDEDPRGYMVHTGPANGEDHHFRVKLPVSFNTHDANTTVHLNMDISQWFEGPALYDFRQYTAIMNDPYAQRLVRANGHNVFSAEIGE